MLVDQHERNITKENQPTRLGSFYNDNVRLFTITIEEGDAVRMLVNLKHVGRTDVNHIVRGVKNVAIWISRWRLGQSRLRVQIKFGCVVAQDSRTGHR